VGQLSDKKPDNPNASKTYVYQIKTKEPLEAGKVYKIVIEDKRSDEEKEKDKENAE
jgi:hypothetical protein